MDFRVLLGGLAVLTGFVSDFFFLRGIVRDHLKPHAFSWLVWSIAQMIAFAAQLSEGAGPGAWITGTATITTTLICILSFRRGTSSIVLFDVIALCGSGIALFLWYLTKDPTLSVILATTFDASGYLPTYRKAYEKPWEENVPGFAFSGFKFLFALPALTVLSISTAFYPLVIMLFNFSVVVLLLWRRKSQPRLQKAERS